MEAPEFYNIAGYINGSAAEVLTKKRNAVVSDQKPAGGDGHFAVDDLLDFPNDDDDGHDAEAIDEGLNFDIITTTTTADSCNSSAVSPGGNFNPSNYQSFADSCFSGELSVPYDDLAELEWLSNFVEDSFSTDHQNLQITNFHFLSGPKPPTVSESSSSGTYPEPITRNIPNNLMFQSDTPLPGKARSKRSRAAPCDWTTRLLHVSRAGAKAQPKKERNPNPNPNPNTSSETIVRRCTHCASEKTPQWRTGPMGPKTLCNACGVRFKSGRLVPEYRPAASPTFVPTKHSNSHRKVLELRRQVDMHRVQQEQFLNQRSIFGVTNGGDDFLMHHHGGPNYRHIM